MKYTLKAHVCYFDLMVGLLHYLYSSLHEDFYTSENIINIEYTLPWAQFEFTTLVVIGTDYTGSCKYNYHTSTTKKAPYIHWNWWKFNSLYM